MSSSYRPSKRQRNDSPYSIASTVLDSPEATSREMNTPPTLIMTPGGENIVSGQETRMEQHDIFSEIMKNNKQKYTMKIFTERLFDKYGNVEYDIKSSDKKLFYLFPATKEQVIQANNREITLYNRDGEPVQSNDLFNDFSKETSTFINRSSNSSGNTSNEYLSSYSSTDKFGGTPVDNKERTFEVLQQLKSDNKLSQKQMNYMFFTYVKNGVLPATIEMLLSKTIDVNMVEPNGHTPLMIASKYGHDKIVKLLLQNGAKPNMENIAGWTAMDFASEYLIDKGLSKEEILKSELFSLLVNAGGVPGSSFYDNIIYPQNTRGMRHMTTSPGIDDKNGGKKITRKKYKKSKNLKKKTRHKKHTRKSK